MKAVGIDGCKGGWVAACYEDGTVKVCGNLKKLIESYDEDYHFLIDMPIGLVSQLCKIRACETEARRVLINRKLSVFNVPCREALDAKKHKGTVGYDDDEAYDKAKNINYSVQGCRISKQTWHIMDKIKEVDILLSDKPQLRFRVKESHPEVAFQFLNGGHALADKKKTKNGIKQRMDVLMRFDSSSQKLYDEALEKYFRKDVARDDIIDALGLALTLKLSKGNLQTLPKNPSLDEARITMAIHYYAPK